MANVRVGVGCFISSKDPSLKGCVLLGKRKGSHGAGRLALPGGHLELGESWELCASREVEEETALKIGDLRYVYATNDPNIDGKFEKHYITIFMHGTVASDSPPLQLMEPHKCEGWEWIPWEKVVEIANTQPELLFDPLLHLIQGEGNNIVRAICSTI